MTVLSLFDGMSCGQIALANTGVPVSCYYAAEIDKKAIAITQKNFPSTIQLGDVRTIRGRDLPPIDLLIGGSPCQDFSSLNNKGRAGLDGEKSQLFYEYLRLKEELQPTFFLLENVVVEERWKHLMTRLLGVPPIKINASLLCAASRNRLYWSNIATEFTHPNLFGESWPIIQHPADKGLLLKDVIDSGYVTRDKHSCLTTECGSRLTRKEVARRIALGRRDYTLIHATPDCDYTTDDYRTINIREMERLHGLPSGYLSGLSQRAAGILVGNGWAVPVIEHLFKPLLAYCAVNP